MAVIITDMYKPGCCSGCKLCDKGNLTDYGQFGKCLLTNNRVNLLTWSCDENCPLNSTDEMLAEIENYNVRQNFEGTSESFMLGVTRGLDLSAEIIHKYCDKE